MQLREETAVKRVSKDFIQDLFLVAYTWRVRVRFGWPDPDGLGMLLELWDARISVGYSDLLQTGLFGSQRFWRDPTPPSESVLTFLNYYKRYDFLQPPEVGRYGVKSAEDSGKKVMPQVRADGGGDGRVSLAKEMNLAMAVVQERREGKINGVQGAGKEVLNRLKTRKLLNSLKAVPEEAPSGAPPNADAAGRGGTDLPEESSDLESILEELGEAAQGGGGSGAGAILSAERNELQIPGTASKPAYDGGHAAVYGSGDSMC